MAINIGANVPVDADTLEGNSSSYFATAASIATKVANTTTVNGKALTSNIAISKTDIGLDQVENYSAANMPVSTATQNALDALTGGSYLPLTGGGAVIEGFHHIRDSGSYTLPPVTGTAVTIGLLAAIGTSPTFTADGTDVVKLNGTEQDTSVDFTSQALVILVSNIDHWDMVEIMINGDNAHTHLPAEVGLGDVDNTSDLNKPVSTAQKLEIDKAKIFGFAGMVM